VHELRFEDNTRFTVEPDEPVSLLRSIGGHELRFQAAIAVSPLTEAGQILALEADLIGHAPAPINEARSAGGQGTSPTRGRSPSTGSRCASP
jgi:hypothetical protein